MLCGFELGGVDVITVLFAEQKWVVSTANKIIKIYHQDRRDGSISLVWTGFVCKGQEKIFIQGRTVAPKKDKDYTPFKKTSLLSLIDELNKEIEKQRNEKN